MTDGAKEGEVKDLNLDEQQKETKATDNGGNNDLEALKKELASRDKKINELLGLEKARTEEAEKQRLANLSLEEKYNELQAKIQKQEEISNFISLGLTSEQAGQLVDCESKFERDKLLAQFTSTKAVESFKAEQLAKITDEPKVKNDVAQTAFDTAFKRGMGLN